MVLDWQITATTIYCDAVDDDVTILVYGDWSTKCTGYNKYHENLNSGTIKILKQKSKSLKRTLKCEGPLDYRVTDFRDKLIEQEKITK